MAAAKYNISVDQGATFQLKLTIKDSDGNLIDITAWAFEGKIRKIFSGPALASFSFAIQNQITNTGEVILSMSNSVTSAIPAEAALSSYVYDIESTYGGAVTRLIQGSVAFSAEITK